MNTTNARLLARELMDNNGLTNWTFKYDNAKVRFGYCSHREMTISLSRPLTELNDLDEVNRTILHEIAHALAGRGHGHDRVWRQKCRDLGINPERCYSDTKVTTPQGKYVARCNNCNYEFNAHRKRKRGSACAACCNKYNNGRFDPQYLLEYKEIR